MSISNTGLLLFVALVFPATAQLTVDQIRLPGAALDLSTRNEVGNAIRLACDWLASRQNPQGAWGVSNDVSLTSIALTALCVSRNPQHSDSQTRAALWLKSTADHQIADMDTHALRLLALSLALPDAPVRSNLFASLSAKAQAASNVCPPLPADAELWCLAAAAAGLRPAAAPARNAEARLGEIADHWPPFPCANRELWRVAKTINQDGQGVLTRGDTRLDWRSETAGHLLGAQRREPQGGGYWDAPDQDRRILETAWGILALSEL